MQWVNCSDRMDQYVIKKDGTAVDIEYFMATHVPFRDLEFIEFGDTDSKSIRLNEEQIYEGYIVNRTGKHQMLIVRGTNGTGKSHLICWLHNRFVSDWTNYNPEKEKVVFLRRLGNTVRGAVQQMLDEGIVQDKELQEKFIKFISAAESQSEEELKTTIYSEYAKRVLTDSTNHVFKSIECKNIAAFLHDTRVQDYMMRPEGPVDKCYQMITTGAKSVVTDEVDTIFSTEDFRFPKEVARAIKNESAEEVKSFYLFDLREDEKMIQKLVDYLNHFTSGVMQSCANITSENARDLFVNLRKSLYKEGKKLTIFIEDFTSFSIVESELITALSVENGGNYSDLCSVTSVIGITDGYYSSFRDNFKDRVTKQIKVTEQSFGGDKFLLEMAARYLNAIYCGTDAVKDWYQGSAVGDTLPVTEFKLDYEWDSVDIDGVTYTLYPFNRRSLLAFYNLLKVKTPRNFLTYVIQHFFALFADGMEYGEGWRFPELPSYIASVSLQPPYADSVENLPYSETDKQRLKILFSIWGDGTTEATDGAIGGISKRFLRDIGFGAFQGVSSTSQGKTSSGQLDASNAQKTIAASPERSAPRLTPEESSFHRKKQDIQSWFDEKKTLEYSSDYNKWVASFVVQAIPWQDEGFPGDFVTKRYRSGNFVAIEDSRLDMDTNKAIVIIERSPESRTVLMGLTLFDFYKNWDFEDAAYYQLVLINWLEKNKQIFIDRLFGKTVGTTEHPILTWCLAVEYLQRLLYGEKLQFLPDEELLRQLVIGKSNVRNDRRLNSDWNDVLTFLSNQTSVKGVINNYLTAGSNTIMGIVGERAAGGVPFYRTRELLNSVNHLKVKKWDICDELKGGESEPYENVRKHLKSLYAKIYTVIESEKKLAETALKNFENLIGEKPSEEDYMDVVAEIQKFYVTCHTAHESYTTELKMKFDGEPQEQAQIAIGYYQNLKEKLENADTIELLQFFSQRPVEKMQSIIDALNSVEDFAKKQKEAHSKMLGDVEQVDSLVLEAACTKLEELSNRIAEMEVAE